MKQKISRGELEDKLLSAIRDEPGCAGVEEISVTAVNIVGEQSTWHVNVISEGSVELKVARLAAGRVQDRMLELYEIQF